MRKMNSASLATKLFSTLSGVACAYSLTLLGYVQTSQAADGGQLWLDSKDQAPAVSLNLPSFAPLVDKLGPAVVNISTEGRENLNQMFTRGGKRKGEQESLPFPFDQLPLPPELEGKKEFKTHSLGSGFIIHPDGYLLTNNHVVDQATKIFVSFKDQKKTFRAEVIGRDKKTDLALLKVIDAPKPMPAVVLGDSDALKPGDWVIAIGNPFRLGHTVTAGIVSAKSRRVPGGGPYDDFIQTDASINPGNSGGPLFNSNGEVVGINTAIFSPGMMGGNSGFNIGIGFATPINLVKSIVQQLHSGGKVVRGWLGVLIQPVSEDVAQALKLANVEGALVADVLSDSPAELGGIKRGDVITKYDGKPVKENDELPLMVAQTEIGKKVAVDLVRDGKDKQVEIKIKELAEEKEGEITEPGADSKLGVTVQDLTPDLAKTLGMDDVKGVVVTNVAPDSAAFEAGIRTRDVILEVGSKAVSSAKDFKAATQILPANQPTLFLVKRGENTIFLTLKLE